MMSALESPQDARILVVDDDASTRRGYEIFLRAEGYRVVTAASGTAALERIRSDAFDLVISDVNMPDGDGLALTRKLREESDTRDLPIILISAIADRRRQVSALDDGADDFLQKPVDIDDLMARVRVALRHARRHRELLERSRYDAVTGALTRRAIDEELDRELNRATRTGRHVSVMLTDIDGFKRLNDEHGHVVGDAVLRGVTETLRGLLRDSDQIGRYGGDELLVVLPDTDRDALTAVERRVALAWRRHPPLVPGTAQPVFISCGAASSSGSASQRANRAALTALADSRMYAVKRRNTR